MMNIRKAKWKIKRPAGDHCELNIDRAESEPYCQPIGSLNVGFARVFEDQKYVYEDENTPFVRTKHVDC